MRCFKWNNNVCGKYESISEMIAPRGGTYSLTNLKPTRFSKYSFLVICITFTLFLYWVQVSKDLNYTYIDQKSKFNRESTKYILLWSGRDFAPFSILKEGQLSFLKANCSVTNCYVTANRTLFGSNYTKFDAVAFNGRKINLKDLPKIRSSHQKYIYFNMESSDNYPICNPKYDGYFNWTATYKLDSDIPWPYIVIRDKKGEIVGPKRDMQWIKNMEPVRNEYDDIIENKTKAAAWFVSNCRTRSKRKEFVKKLQKVLKGADGRTVDIYGKCGTLKCPRNKQEECNSLLEKDYFFYMSLENSFAEDYVTEKLLTAMEQNIVPIVYGGANYSRFLPPGSYIDGRKQGSDYLAGTIDRLINMPEKYSQFFRWKKYYTYSTSKYENVCAICKALNDESMMLKTSSYKRFRSWWNPGYKKRC